MIKMCRTATPKEKQELCSRCGGSANPNDGWEHGWPLYGRLEIGFPAQIFGALGGMTHIAEAKHFKQWREGHPAIVEYGAQDVVFEWGNGYRFDSRGRYRLCLNCQKNLLKVLGEFFIWREKKIGELGIEND